MSKKRNDARTAIRNVKWSLRLLDGEEREHAIRPLREIVLADAYERNTSSPSNPEACARCGCIDIVRRGRNQRDGSQRWLCMGCHRTFGNKTNRVIARSKLKPAVWMQYVECFIDSLSLAECAERCGVSVRTAFHMRHRIIECAQRYMSRFKAGAGEQVQRMRRITVSPSRATTGSPRRSGCPGSRTVMASPQTSGVCRRSKSA